MGHCCSFSENHIVGIYEHVLVFLEMQAEVFRG